MTSPKLKGVDAPAYEHLHGIQRWVTFSTFPRSEKEIKHELLNNFEDVCTLYVLEFSRMSEDFLEEFMVLSTGLLNEQNYDQSYETVKKLLEYKYTYGNKHPIRETIINTSGKAEVISSESVCDRIHWGELSRNQTFSMKFAMKYYKWLDLRELEAREDIDPIIVDAVKAEKEKRYAKEFLVRTDYNILDSISNIRLLAFMPEQVSASYSKLNSIEPKASKLKTSNDMLEAREKKLADARSKRIARLEEARKKREEAKKAKKNVTEAESEILESAAKVFETTKKPATKKRSTKKVAVTE